MINSVTFATRLKTIMEYYDLSASAFSEKIDFNRSTISHILSGRNKPSLEFVMKILEHFPEVTTSWLLYNKGDFPKHTSGAVKEPHVNTIPNNKEIKENPTEAAPSPTSIKQETPTFIANRQKDFHKEIKRIIIFYTDGSFESFEN